MENIHDKEYEERRKAILARRNDKRKKARKIFIKRLSVFLSVVCVIVLVILSLTVFFPLNSIKTKGNIKGTVAYTDSQIIEASGIKIGQNFFVSGSGAEENIIKKLPYISSVNIEKSFPSSVVISITYAKENICYVIGKDYYVCDVENKLLAIKKSEPKLPLVIGLKADNPEIGSKLAFTKKENFDVCSSLKTKISKMGIKINSINVSDTLNLRMRIKDKFIVKFGSSGNLDKKIAHLEQMLKNIDENLVGTIDLSVWTAENPRGIFTQGE